MADTDEQPDFNLLSLAFRTAADETQKLANLPAIAGGQRLLLEIQQMRRETREQYARMEEIFAILEEQRTIRCS